MKIDYVMVIFIVSDHMNVLSFRYKALEDTCLFNNWALSLSKERVFFLVLQVFSWFGKFSIIYDWGITYVWIRLSLNIIESRLIKDTSLFITERRPKRRMSIENLRYIIKRISNRAGIKKSIHPHQLRHSYATHLINNGAPLEAIQSLLGHEKSETTKIYAQLSGKLRHDLYSKYFWKLYKLNLIEMEMRLWRRVFLLSGQIVGNT